MGALAEIAERLRALPENRFIREIINERTEEIEDLNTDQLDRGIDGNGRPVEPFYTPFTVSIKEAKGQPSDRVTLKDTGDFHKSFETDIFKDRFSLKATDPKTEDLTEKYGEDIFGLTLKSREDLKTIIKDELEDRIRKYLL